MREGRAKKYMMWLMYLTVSLAIPVMMLLFFGSDFTDDFRSGVSYFRMSLSSTILIVTILMGLLVPNPWAKMPRWIVVLLIYAMVGYFAALFFLAYIDPESITFGSFLYIYSLTINVFFLNVILVFFIQTWVVYERWNFHSFAPWLVHGLFLVWTFLALLYPYNTALIVISAACVLAAVPVAMLVEIWLDKRALAMVERIGKIYL